MTPDVDNRENLVAQELPIGAMSRIRTGPPYQPGIFTVDRYRASGGNLIVDDPVFTLSDSLSVNLNKIPDGKYRTDHGVLHKDESRDDSTNIVTLTAKLISESQNPINGIEHTFESQFPISWELVSPKAKEN